MHGSCVFYGREAVKYCCIFVVHPGFNSTQETRIRTYLFANHFTLPRYEKKSSSEVYTIDCLARPKRGSLKRGAKKRKFAYKCSAHVQENANAMGLASCHFIDVLRDFSTLKEHRYCFI